MTTDTTPNAAAVARSVILSLGRVILLLLDSFELVYVAVDSLAHSLALARLNAVHPHDRAKRTGAYKQESDHALALLQHQLWADVRDVS